MMLSQLEMTSIVAGNCLAWVFGISAGLLIGAAITGGAGLLIAGAYEPLLGGFCG